MRNGWVLEDGVNVHTASEMAVTQDDNGDWIVVDLEDAQVGGTYPTPMAAMDAVDASYAERPRHAHEW